jgi:2-amino-4-hydroxy-6-hydroxymethyldihydropteridine diphosphokinase
LRRVYFGIGSNLGDRAHHLQAAVDGMAAAPDVRVVAVSPVYETAPVGGPAQPDYLNAVVAVDSTRTARDLLDLAQRLERVARRERQERWGPRTLDVDLLLVGAERVAEPDLVVPHPRMGQRAFVLVPLADLDPAWAEAASAAGAAGTAGGQAGIRPTGVQLTVPE